MHYARCVNYPFTVNLPTVTLREPARNSLMVAVGHTGITEYAVFHPSVQSIDDGGGCTEIHISHPHRQYMFTLGTVPFVGTGSPSRNLFIEVVFHIFALIRKTGPFVPESDFTIGGSLDVLVYGY